MRHAERAEPHVSPLQVQQHAEQDGALSGALQHRRVQHVDADVRPQQPRAVGIRQHGATVERIDDQRLAVGAFVRLRRAAHEEMAGEVHALHCQAGTAGDLDEDDGERDWNPGTPFDDVVQEAVARVFILLTVAGEPELPEEELR